MSESTHQLNEKQVAILNSEKKTRPLHSLSMSWRAVKMARSRYSQRLHQDVVSPCRSAQVPVVFVKLLGDMGFRYGYPASSLKYFGQTAARKGFVQDSNKNLAGSSFDIAMHLMLNADHSRMVSRSNYQNDNAYRASIPANVLHGGMPTETA